MVSVQKELIQTGKTDQIKGYVPSVVNGKNVLSERMDFTTTWGQDSYVGYSKIQPYGKSSLSVNFGDELIFDVGKSGNLGRSILKHLFFGFECRPIERHTSNTSKHKCGFL